MDDFNRKDDFSNTYYNPNNQLYKNLKLNYQMKRNNYINQNYNEYESISKKQMLSNNKNTSKDSLSLIQIKNDLNLLNDKLNIISETLFNMNLFNMQSKKKINLKKCNSMNNKIIKHNKKISPYIYNPMYNIQNTKLGNKIPNKIIMNNINNEINNNNVINNKKICRNNCRNNNEIYSDINNQVNSYENNYLFQSMNIYKPSKNKKIKNIKYQRNNSLLNTNLIKNDKYTFDDTLNNNTVLTNTKSINSPINILNQNVEYNNYFNSYFGLYDQYFLESLSDNNQINGKNNNNTQNVKDIILNELKNNKVEQNNIINKTINNNKNDVKKRLNFSLFDNSINPKKDFLKYKNSPKLLLSKKQNSFNIINNKITKNEQTKEKNQEYEKNIINNYKENSQTQNNNQLSKYEEIIKKNKEEEKIQKDNDENANKIKAFKKRKKLSFHEEDNITIEYNQKDEITKINVYNFFGENQNFRPRNFNVIIEKLKRKKYQNNSILFKKTLKKDLTKEEKQKNKSIELKKIKRVKSKISISSKKEEMLLNKYILKKRNSHPKNKKNNYIQKRNKICKRFRNNPQLFYGEELCDLVIKSFDTDGECLNIIKDKSRNKMKKINYNKSYDKRGNLTDIDMDNRPMEYLQKIIEETE